MTLAKARRRPRRLTRPRATAAVVTLARIAVVVALAAAVAVMAACDRARPPRNLLLVSIDTLRADRVGAYGHSDAGTAAMDSLARRGTRFADVTAPTPLTLPTHASLFTGLAPHRHGVRHNGLFALADEATTLAEALAGAGYRTGGFVGSVVLAPRQGVAQGFEAWTSPQADRASGLFFLGERPAARVNADALGWLDGVGEEDPFFLFVHYMEPHAPYAPPPDLAARHSDDPYQGEVAAADRALGRLLDGLETRGRLDDTLVVVVSDHGEDLGDHGEGTHGLFLYQSTLAVPWIVAGPGVAAGQVIEEPVALVDVAATVLDALGVGELDGGDGVSLWDAVRGDSPPDPERDIHAETFEPLYDYGWSDLRALRRGSMKLIEAPRDELYDLSSDPAEQHDLTSSRPSLARDLLERLEEGLERGEAQALEPASAPALSTAEREALAALGYLGGSHVPTSAGERPDPKDRYRDAVELDRAGWLMREGRAGEAEALLEQLIARHGDLFEARVSLVVARRLQGDEAGALEAGREAVRRAMAMPDGERVAARVHVLMSEIHREAGRWAEAIAELEAALAQPQPPERVTLLAAMHVDEGQRERAVELLRGLADRGDETPQSLALLAWLEGRGPHPITGAPPR